jgi:hypothetical protein
MGTAYTIVLDNEDPGFDICVNGTAVAGANSELTAVCDKLGLPALGHFLTLSREEIDDLLAEDIQVPTAEPWFAPDDGLKLIGALAGHLAANPQDVNDAQGVLANLAEYAEVLTRARSIGARWRLDPQV